jgi:predicted transcriptional regulator
MDLASEKADIIRRFEDVNDASLIQAIKSILDFGLNRESKNSALDSSIDKALEESNKGETRPHNEVMTEIRARFKT